MALPFTARTQVRSVLIQRQSNAGINGASEARPGLALFSPSAAFRACYHELASSDQSEDVALQPSDLREAAAIFIAPGDPMLSRASSAASTRSGLVRAMRPRITRHSSSAIALVASMTSAQGACWSNRSRIGRTSILPIRPREQAASLATTKSRVLQQFEQQQEWWRATGVHSDSRRRGSRALRAAAMTRSRSQASRP